jgi:uncharacterized membrane-anchored protein YhcB (DUF1043 family)
MENKRPNTSSDEIDLGQLFSKIGDFFRNIGLGFMRFLALIRRIPLENKLPFGLIISGSVVFGIAYANLLQKNYYESTMILSSDYLNKRLVDNTIGKLNLLAGEKSKSGVAKILNIPDTLARNILGFTAKPFVAESDLIELEVLKEQLRNAQANAKNDQVINQVINRIEIENRHAFEITVRTLNPTVIGNLETALVSFFRNNDYIKRRIDINKSNLTEKKQKLSDDLGKLDSLKSIIYDNYRNMAAQGRQGSNNVILSDKAVTNPIEVYNQDLDLYQELQSINSRLYLQPDFEVVDGFTEFSEPSSPSISKIIVISLLVGIGIGYLLIAIAGFNQYLAGFSK